MKTRKNRILVPIDFTAVSNAAIEYAVSFAKSTKFEINLLHVIEKPLIYIGRSDVFENQLVEEATMSRLRKIETSIEKKHKLKVSILAITGNIFETINQVAEEIGANFIILGTHGKHGIQHLIGSNALRIVTESKIPYLIVHEQPKKKTVTYKDLVFPIDYQKESKEKAAWAIFFSKMFGSSIHILMVDEKDEFLKRKINDNLHFCTRLFKKHKVDYTEKSYPKDIGNLADETVEYAASINADAIMIMVYPEHGSGSFFTTPAHQRVINNEYKIPVLGINTMDIYVVASLHSVMMP